MGGTRDDRQNPPKLAGREPVTTAEREKRLQAEQSLRQSEEIFRLLIESVRDYAIFMLNPDGYVETWNLGAGRIKGYSAEEVIGQHFSLFYQEKDVTRGWPEYELKVAATEGRFEDEGWRVRKDGSLFWANVIITAVYDGDRLCGFSKVTRDLTERKRTEEELRQARDLLEERVQERTAELTHANARLENEIEERRHAEEKLLERSQQIETLLQELAVADRRKNEFLATLAHELRNPLAPIRNALQILHLAPGPDIQRQTLGVIDRQLGQMVRLVDDLLDISRITNNKLQLRKKRIELADAIQSALETTRPFIEGAGHELTVRLPPEPVYVEADLTRLAQVFINLLNNSTKYTERGGHIGLTVETQGREVAVSVRDNGIGITAEHLPHLFEMFSQAAPALERSGGGLGVGLALARGVVELHGGSIEARSEGLGKGSEITVRLPVAAAPAGKQQPSGAETELHRGFRCRVLIADDNRDSADSLSVLLELAGHETWASYDGLQAFEAARSHNPDVALLDIGMPKINGYEVARRIRQEPWGKRILLVAITGWGQDDDKQQAREAGFDHHLTKPVNLADLRALLDKASRGRQEPSPE